MTNNVYPIVCEMLCDAKDLPDGMLTPDMPLYQLKLDSLDYVELMVLVKREFDLTLSAEMFVNNPNLTLGEMCQTLEEQRA
ncbi:acyl carrier protein [Rahnella inusitata]|uniref:acyl carrier protein n=1 Tax=Rahnella inusitata TaxID=58169 RepID=UPI0039B053DA